jgi:hypothetical protein
MLVFFSKKKIENSQPANETRPLSKGLVVQQKFFDLRIPIFFVLDGILTKGLRLWNKRKVQILGARPVCSFVKIV